MEQQYMLFHKQIQNIYNHIGNERSKRLFCDRLLYSLTGDKGFLRQVIESTAEGKDFRSKINNDKKKFIFSAGTWGCEIINSFPDISFEGFIDNKVGDNQPDVTCLGYPVISFKKYLQEYSSDCVVIIASRLYYREIYCQLCDAGIPDGLIVNAGKIIDDMSIKQYFDLSEMNAHRQENEIFVDAGSFDGRTSILFSEWCQKSNQLTKRISVYAFEPDKKNASKCSTNLSEKLEFPEMGGEFTVIEKGLWSQKKTISFQSSANGTSKVSDQGEWKIEVDRLDNMISIDEPITFIKMDLEGSEYEALLGARNIIEKWKPKLAISLYHKPEDVWELPSLILEMNPSYSLYLAHYSVAAAETVLYAL